MSAQRLSGLIRPLTALLLILAVLLSCVPAPAEAPPVLNMKSSGQKVLDAKKRLQALNYLPKGNLNGRYTEAVFEAVKRFQSLNGLEVTGEVDGATWDVLFSDTAVREPWATMPPVAAPGPTPKPDWPVRDAEGFLNGEGEYFYENDEEGLWIFLNASLQIVITRREDPDIPLVWFETEIIARPGENFRAAVSDPDHVWRGYRYPYEYAKEEGFVLAFSDDFFADRYTAERTVGIIIRNGRILSDKTHRQRGHQLPNLDMMAQYPDGSLKVYQCNEHTAQELLDMGAENVYSFGPILIRDGQIEEMLYDTYYRSLEPRQALGMIGPGHYLLMSFQGRRKDSVGTPLQRIAEMMKARGVTQALNLDGGNTMALIFRGRMLNKLATYKNKEFIRQVTSIIGIGHTLDQAE